MKKYYKDIILVVLLLVISAIIYWGYNFFSGKGNKVCIYVNDEKIEEFNLGEDIEKKFTTKYGTNTIKIKDGSVSVISASCDNQICVNHIKVSKTGESIICLPNHFVVTIEGKEDKRSENGDLDGIAK